MKRLTAKEVHALKVAELGLDQTALDLSSIEAVAGALRRTASFLCPCTAPTLVRSVLRPLRGLLEDPEATKLLVEETLEAMIAHGDIHEHPEIGEGLGHSGRPLLYAGPPSFILRQSGTAIVLGVATDQLSALPDELESRIEYINHVRRLVVLPGEDLRGDLTELGLLELSYGPWLKSPPPGPPEDHVSRIDGLLDATSPSRDIPGLLLLDSTRPVHYYRNRWVEPRLHSGRFVARRTRTYGADLWCYVHLRDGHPERMLDFPLAGSPWRGCDEAWHMQLAIDAQRGTPQKFRVLQGVGGTRVLQLFSPVPMWARRRWDSVGEPALSSGCLFAYRFTDVELAEELRFAEKGLWLDELSGSVQGP